MYVYIQYYIYIYLDCRESSPLGGFPFWGVHKCRAQSKRTGGLSSNCVNSSAFWIETISKCLNSKM